VPWSGAPDCPVCHRTVSGAPTDSVRCTRELNSELLTFRNSGSRSAIIHRTVQCSTGLSGVPAEQRLLRANGRLQRTLNALQCAAARAEVRARARRRTGQSTGPVRCTTGLSGGPEDRSSNGRTLMVGVTWLAHRTVRCAIRQQPPPTVLLVVGAINTPNHPPFMASKFSAFKHLTRAIAFNTRHNQRDQILSQVQRSFQSNSDL
jgi:hypothetical protein